MRQAKTGRRLIPRALGLWLAGRVKEIPKSRRPVQPGGRTRRTAAGSDLAARRLRYAQGFLAAGNTLRRERRSWLAIHAQSRIENRLIFLSWLERSARIRQRILAVHFGPRSGGTRRSIPSLNIPRPLAIDTWARSLLSSS